MNYLELAQFMHEEYEKIAKKNNWKTQKVTQVSFKKLPLENQQTMLELAKKVLFKFNVDRERIEALIIEGLITDGSHHKQWYLEETLKEIAYSNFDELKEEHDWENGQPN